MFFINDFQISFQCVPVEIAFINRGSTGWLGQHAAVDNPRTYTVPPGGIIVVLVQLVLFFPPPPSFFFYYYFYFTNYY